MLTAEALRKHITPATKAILLAYPSNPTGAVMTRDALEGVAEIARDHDLFVISDEIYDRPRLRCRACLFRVASRHARANGAPRRASPRATR